MRELSAAELEALFDAFRTYTLEGLLDAFRKYKNEELFQPFRQYSESELIIFFRQYKMARQAEKEQIVPDEMRTNEELCNAYQRGDKSALEQLLKQNERLMMKLVRFNIRRLNLRKESFNDYLSECCISMIKAAKSFKRNNGSHFSSYAYKCIKNHFSDYAVKQNEEEIPEPLWIDWRRCDEDYDQYGKIVLSEAYLYMDGPTDEEAIRLRRTHNVRECVDILAQQGDEEKEKQHKQRIAEYLKVRFGFYSGEVVTIEEAGKQCKMSKKSAQKTEKEALEELKPILEKSPWIYLEETESGYWKNRRRMCRQQAGDAGGLPQSVPTGEENKDVDKVEENKKCTGKHTGGETGEVDKQDKKAS